MEISTEIMLAGGTVLASVAASWGVSQWRHDRQDKENGNLWREVGKVRDNLSLHERIATDERLKIHESLTEIRIAGAKTDEKFSAIMGILEQIKEDMSRIKDGKN